MSDLQKIKYSFTQETGADGEPPRRFHSAIIKNGKSHVVSESSRSQADALLNASLRLHDLNGHYVEDQDVQFLPHRVCCLIGIESDNGMKTDFLGEGETLEDAYMNAVRHAVDAIVATAAPQTPPPPNSPR